tara:strand:+ start:1179 stop:2150 length:972 start_codon:yes stop_codon:yes gene_type:complete
MNQDEFFEISAVAQITGISPHVLRVWERRYSVVEPGRSESKRRQYTQADIDRLVLLKTLVSNGQSIGSVASLSTEKLQERALVVNEAKLVNPELDENSTLGEGRIGLVGTLIRQPVREAADRSPQIRIIGEFEDVDEMRQSFQPGSLDIVIVERDTLFVEDVIQFQEMVDELQAHRAIIVYRFAQSEVFDRLEGTQITALRGPIEVAGIQLALGTLTKELPARERIEYGSDATEEGAIPVRIFSDEQLVRIAKTSSSINCECPKHLSNILRGLYGFEQYSLQCESLDEADEDLHRFLHFTTAQSRHKMERALVKVLSQEGIEY